MNQHSMSEKQVRTVLNLEKKLENKPVLQEMLITGEVSMHKLERVKSVVTVENQEFWATQVKILPNRALETNELLQDFLDQREENIAKEKEEVAKEVREGATKLVSAGQINSQPSETTLMKASRYIPIKIKKLLSKEHGTACSVPTCHKQARTIHHTQRFSLVPVHDPRYLAPLCKEHHAIAHGIDVRVWERRRKL